jgi:hypothetical protein
MPPRRAADVRARNDAGAYAYTQPTDGAAPRVHGSGPFGLLPNGHAAPQGFTLPSQGQGLQDSQARRFATPLGGHWETARIRKR